MLNHRRRQVRKPNPKNPNQKRKHERKMKTSERKVCTKEGSEPAHWRRGTTLKN
ncbi:hypothetical protein HMPREF0294_1266 [Corynebacterium glucuronolyticum ATCC 51867]|nr:hypothetical protein HMPREF0294_1266 [Corynebacterium glucuronolyticum ATCC 51867]